MLICGLTFDHSTNYGSCFQAYALQTAIEKIKIQGEHCHFDFIPYTLIRQNKLKWAEKESYRKKIKSWILLRIKRSRRKRFEEFEKRYMHYAECNTMSDLPLLNEKYDAFVCGSDVIWNFKFTHADPAYFLSFADKYKFSYAASFGKADIYDDNDDIQYRFKTDAIYKQYISKLDSVSVREKSALGTASRFTEKQVVHVLDPVLLLSAKEWEMLLRGGKKKKRYIFAYSTYSRDYFNEFLKKLQQQTGLPVVHVVWNAVNAIKQRTWNYPDPENWLALLRNADYVVTNSFHATAFSTIFHKKFYTVLRYGKLAGANIRMYDFLHAVGLENRIITETPDIICVDDVPDFSVAELYIETERKKSLAYLESNLEQAFWCSL